MDERGRAAGPAAGCRCSAPGIPYVGMQVAQRVLSSCGGLEISQGAGKG